MQNSFSAQVPLKAVPLQARVFSTHNYAPGNDRTRMNYQFHYSKDAFRTRLGLDEAELKRQATERLQFGKLVNYDSVVQAGFSAIPGVDSLIGQSGSSWKELLEMPESAFVGKFDAGALDEELAEALRLKGYYAEHLSKAPADSFLAARAQQADSQHQVLRKKADVQEKLMRLKRHISAVQQRKAELQRLYDEKLSKALAGVNAVAHAIRQSGLSGLQRFMLNVKGISAGRHTLSCGNLALRNYLQNGISFEYETDRFYLLLTKGSQEKVEYMNGFVPLNSSQNGISEFYRYDNRYRLEGVALGKGSRSGNYRQVSVMHFTKVDAGVLPSFFAKAVTVITAHNRIIRPGVRFEAELSKSVAKDGAAGLPGRRYRETATFFRTMALDLNYDLRNVAGDFQQRFHLYYSSLLYNNPGLNGGNRPGLQLAHNLERRFQKFRLVNNAACYLFNYGNESTLRTYRNKTDLSYRLKAGRVGIMVNGSLSEMQYAEKQRDGASTLDLLGTGGSNQRLGPFDMSVNGGLGYGFSKDESFGNANDFSFFLNSSFAYKSLAFECNIDKFQTRNTQVFLRDSAALFLTSAFNLDAMLVHTGADGNVFQAGLQYKELAGQGDFLFLAGSCSWRFAKGFTFSASGSFPVGRPLTEALVNNIFQTRFIYNINTHEK
ncbi:MAG: hypothetical protein EOO16_08495 [Chitinophagaceae bacterium]|nr:MAG: hypothetical protein EOO16_08495 [Chitinophagaceae bacterium]